MPKQKVEQNTSERHLRKPEGPKAASSEELHRTQQMTFGPVRIKIADVNRHYKKLAFASVCNGLTQMMIGAVNIIAFGYTMKTKNLHVLFCTAGWHLFTIQAILALSFTNSWASVFLFKHKKLIHLILQICGLVFIITGSVIVIVTVKIANFEAHGIVGLVTLVMTLITVMSGPMAYLKNQNMKIFHVLLALPTFVLTCVCLCLGLLKPAMGTWVESSVPYTLIGFIAFYTIFILVTVLYKVHLRLKYIRILERLQ